MAPLPSMLNMRGDIIYTVPDLLGDLTQKLEQLTLNIAKLNYFQERKRTTTIVTGLRSDDRSSEIKALKKDSSFRAISLTTKNLG